MNKQAKESLIQALLPTLMTLWLLFSMLTTQSCTGIPGDGSDTTVVDTTDTTIVDTTVTDTTTGQYPVDDVVSEKLLAFPGALGPAAETTSGGRGGRIMFVTNLNDSGKGSFREAWEASGPRIVIPRVSGNIIHKSKLSMNDGNYSFYGQLGVGQGITVRDYTLQINRASNVLVQNLRSRIGPEGSERYDMKDGIRLNSPNGEITDVIIDHCSFSWSVDENISSWRTVKRVTIQYCISSEGLRYAGHLNNNGLHSMGMVFSKGDGITTNEDVAIVYNYLAHNNARNAKLNEGVFRFQRNIVYNFGTWGTYISTGNEGSFKVHADVVENLYVRGPFRGNKKAIEFQNPIIGRTSVYMRDNTYELNDRTLSEPFGGSSSFVVDAPETEEIFDGVVSSSMNREQLEEHILSNVGANRPARDAVDERVISEYYTRTGNEVTHPNDVGGWPVLGAGTLYLDEDNDGMPDEWEVVNGYDVTRDDSAEDADGDGYTNIEEMAHLATIYELPYIK